MSCLDEFDQHWDYDDPSKWSEQYPAAKGLCQSPINIKFGETVKQHYPPFTFSPKYKDRLLFTLRNTSKKLTVTLAKKQHNKNQTDLWVTGGGLNGTFHFVNFHLHWGNNDRHGSEHEFNGYRFPAEAHFVYKNFENQKFFRYMGSLTAPPCTEGIVWSVFFNIVPISEHSLNLLRNNVVRTAFRPVQPINHRIIYRNFDF
ncbi:unnamed protein product [Rotaria sp. Silwood1]|nr:unnamed protein product [Rotaria sp. Silwood1]